MPFLDSLDEITLREQIQDIVAEVPDIDLLHHTQDELFTMAEALDNIRQVLKDTE